MNGFGLSSETLSRSERGGGVQTAMADDAKLERAFRKSHKHVMKGDAESSQFARLLASSLDTLDVGLEIWDDQDRLVLYNKKINRMRPDFHTPEHIGQTYEALMRANLNEQIIIEAIGHEEEWLTQRLTTRAMRSEPVLQELAGNQWIHLYETRTPEGCLVTAWVDVTPLVHKEKRLEASNHQLVEQSATDALTGLANRRRFDEALVTEWLRAARSGTPISLLMVDIDHFKRYNDHYGHLAGDECLRRVAADLGQCVRRAGELVARYGGEEFVMLLPGADMAHACETAQKCLDRMREDALPHAASPTCTQVTLSIGVACVQPDATLNASLMLNAADAAMYHAKSSGRAKYVIADQDDWHIEADTPRTGLAPLQ
jgi:diguanylate cyclase (GGDEF)-like protein